MSWLARNLEVRTQENPHELLTVGCPVSAPCPGVLTLSRRSVWKQKHLRKDAERGEREEMLECRSLPGMEGTLEYQAEQSHSQKRQAYPR